MSHISRLVLAAAFTLAACGAQDDNKRAGSTVSASPAAEDASGTNASTTATGTTQGAAAAPDSVALGLAGTPYCLIYQSVCYAPAYRYKIGYFVELVGSTNVAACLQG
jgi:hypothetical protein